MKVKLNSLFKVSCAIFATYYTVIMILFTSMRGFLLPLGSVMLAMMLWMILEKKPLLSDVLSVPIFSWILFDVVELIASSFVATNVSFAIDSLITFFELIVMCMCLAFVAVLDRNADFLIKLMYVDSLLYVYFMIITGNTIGGRLALVNANADANVCLIGIVTGSMIIGKCKKWLTPFILLSMIPMVYANLMTGSRKSLYCMAFYVVFWAVTELRTTWKTLSLSKKATVIFIALVIVVLFVRIGIPFFLSSNTYLRMTDSYVINSDEGRILLYQEAWEHFKNNPIFGIGFNQFRLYNIKGLYSHSTYAEILSCGGIVGTILFFIPHFWMVFGLIKIFKNVISYEEKKETLLMLIYVISSLFLAAGMVQTSNERVLMMYSIVIAYVITKKKIIFERHNKQNASTKFISLQRSS